MRIIPFLHLETDDNTISLSMPDGNHLTLRKQPTPLLDRCPLQQSFATQVENRMILQPHLYESITQHVSSIREGLIIVGVI